jgi:hypothetical protein
MNIPALNYQPGLESPFVLTIWMHGGVDRGTREATMAFVRIGGTRKHRAYRRQPGEHISHHRLARRQVTPIWHLARIAAQ